MTFLLAVSIGPVQDFLAAARRTNDFYAGSQLISGITEAASGAVAASGELIFPAPRANKPATPAEDEKASGAGANKILANISATDQKQVREIVEQARNAAVDCLREYWGKTCKLLKSNNTDVDFNISDQQLNTFIEFFAAWQEWDGEDASYQQARKEVERALAARKALRNFKQPQKRNIAKSSLDPSRDAVTTNIPEGRRKAKPLYLKANEQLDAVSVIKRVFGGTGAPSTADIAAETYLLNNPNVSARLCKIAAEKHVKIKSIQRAIYSYSRKEMVEEGDLSSEEAAGIEAAVGAREPTPYLAILLADGDRIGERLGRIESRAQHLGFSARLAEFANGAAGTVEQNNGHCVYSGGDDVLAFLPVHTCLLCAAQLARTFQETVKGCTLSVGIAIVHYHEPLYSSLDFARAAEKLAKNKTDAPANQGNQLAVTLYSRSGQSRSATWNWAAGYGYSTWRTWAEAFAAGLSNGLPYEWERAGREMQHAELPHEAVIAEAMRIFRRKSGAELTAQTAGMLSRGWVKEQLENDSGQAVAADAAADRLLDLSQQLMLFRRFNEFNVQWEEA